MTGTLETARKTIADRHSYGRWIVQWAALLALGALALTADAPGEASAWKMVGQIGGPTQGIAVQGAYAYVGVGMRLVVLDVSNPFDLREVGVTPSFSQAVEDVALSGTLAFVAAGGAGLRVIDVSNPALPTEIGVWDSCGYAQGVAVAQSTAYVADGPYGLRLVDVSKPSQPVELGSAYPMNYAFDVAVQGPYAYIAAAGAGLLIAEVSDPKHPVEAGSLVTDGYAYGVAVAGSTVYLADGWEGVKTVDVADPAHPELAAAYKTPGWAFGVTVSGTTAYVADAFGGLRVLDVANTAQPAEIGSFRPPGGHAGSVAVAGDTAFVADRNWGVRAVNLSAGPELPQVGSFCPAGYADGVEVSGKFAYITDANAGLFVIDISDPTRPRQIGNLDVEGNSFDVEVRGSIAYLTTQGPGLAALHIIDLSDPTRPIRLGFFDINLGQPRGLDVAGDYAYVAIETGVEILNVSDPYRPVRSAFFRTKEKDSDPETAVGVTLAGTLAYIALEWGGIATVDVSDPANPLRRGSFTPGSSSMVRDIAVSGNRAFLADSAFGLRVLDASDSVRLVAMGSLQLPGPESLVHDGSLAFLACGDQGLFVVDLSNPNRPSLVGGYRTLGYTRKVSFAGGRVYLADGPNGLLILETAGSASGATGAHAAMGLAEARDRQRSGGGPSPHPPPPRQIRLEEDASAIASGAAAAPSSCLVTTASDSGAGTMRQCIQDAASGTMITFDPAVFPPDAPESIRLASGLPGIPGGVTIDGSDAGVILDGSGLSAPPGQGGAFGLFIRSDGNTIRGLQILGFPHTGIQIHGSDNFIGGDRSVGRGPVGQGNVISGNRNAGIMISGDGGTASRNVVIGNLIGTDASGTKAMGNGMDGVWVQRATNNRIGGASLADRNIISANGQNGINVSGHSTENLITGNYLGTDVTGMSALANGWSGLVISMGAFGNTIQGNLISGNRDHGVGIGDRGSSYNAILGNRIGTDANGTRAVPNGGHGVFLIATPAGFNRIGGVRTEDRNVVSGNRKGGISIQTSGNLIVGNFVGTDFAGRNPLGNAEDGVSLNRSRNIVGGATHKEANLIASNGWFGVMASANSNTILGNLIGTDASGQAALGNGMGGVTLGGRQSIVQGNVIAYTVGSAGRGGGSGVSFSPEFDCTIRRNSIHHNAGAGIEGAAEPPAPIIKTVGSNSLTGTACPGCEVEIFSDSEDEGRVFEGSTVAEESGAFAFSRESGHFTGPNVTATATDQDGRTSAFSAPVRVPSRPPRRHLGRR